MLAPTDSNGDDPGLKAGRVPASSGVFIFEDLKAGLLHVQKLEQQVKEFGACSLPGVSIIFDSFCAVVESAVQSGHVTVDKAAYVVDGLRHGFGLGVQIEKLAGRIRFRNYPSALEARRFITKATRARVHAGKTLCLGKIDWLKDKHLLPWPSLRVFPLGAVAKPLEPDERRPVSDHTRTGLNAVSDILSHALTA